MEIKKFKFKFFKGVANVLFYRRHSNLFLILLDYKKNHIITLTSGSCKTGKTKKQKVAPLNMIGMVKQLKVYIDKYNIKYINLYIRQRFSFFFYTLNKFFKLHNIIVKRFIFILKRIHGKKRGRKIRRI